MSEMITPQSAFDRVAKHLFEQGRRSVKNSIQCLYRGPDKTKCAIGVLIPDDVYDPLMEGDGADSMIYSYIGFQNLLSEDKTTHEWAKFLLDLQRIHDNRDNWINTLTMRNSLLNTAKSHGLDFSILDSLSFKGK